MCRTFFPSTDNKPERMHSVRPVPRTMTWRDGDQFKKERERGEDLYVVFFIHGGCLLARGGERECRGLEETENPVGSIAVRVHTPTCDQPGTYKTARKTRVLCIPTNSEDYAMGYDELWMF